MKYLSDYTKEETDKLFEESGAFFAFSNDQFKEKADPDKEYELGPFGMVCEKGTARYILDKMEGIHKRGVNRDLEDNGVDAIIERELWNYECFYTGDISDALDALAPYPIQKSQVESVFHKLSPEVEFV